MTQRTELDAGRSPHTLVTCVLHWAMTSQCSRVSKDLEGQKSVVRRVRLEEEEDYPYRAAVSPVFD